MMFHQPPASYIDSVTLLVKDLEQSTQFYHEKLGLSIIEASSDHVKLSADGKNTLVHLKTESDVIQKTDKRYGLYHFALLLPNRGALASLLIQLTHAGIRVASSDHSVSEALYLDDPEGNGIELYVDRDPSTWTWKNREVFMSVDPLDVEGLIQAADNGDSFKAIDPQTVMGHIHLHIQDLNKATTFYETLGFNRVSRLGEMAQFLSTENYHHHIGLNTWLGAGAKFKVPNQTGLASFSITYPNKQKREEIIHALIHRGYPVEKRDNKVITTDPVGNHIQLQA